MRFFKKIQSEPKSDKPGVISKFIQEVHTYAKVYWNSFLALAVFTFAYVIFSWVSGKQLAVIDRADPMLKSPVADAQE